MKKILFIIFLWVIIFINVSAQKSVVNEYKSVIEQGDESIVYKKNRFTVLLDFPSLFFSGGDSTIKTNVFNGIGAGIDYNFSEMMSLGMYISFYYDHTIFLETKEEEKHQTLNFAPVFKVNLGKNQMIVPFLEASYIFSIGKRYCSYEEKYTKNYLRHILSGGVGLKIYASRWFKKTKYKNNFGIESCISKAIFLFDNSINVPLNERFGMRVSFFYKF